MPTVRDVTAFLESFAPMRLAETWDNVGLLAGDPLAQANHVMTCLTVTPNSVDEAITEQAELLVTHHPIPFRPIQRITTEAVTTRQLWRLIRAGVSIYSPHTCFDSAAGGINHLTCEKLSLRKVTALVPRQEDPDGLGAGRVGELERPVLFDSWCQVIKTAFALSALQVVGDSRKNIRRVAIACGSGGSFLEAARQAGCDALLTGEASFHTCVEAAASDIALVMLGHYTSERFGVESLANSIQSQFPTARVWASNSEHDPVRMI